MTLASLPTLALRCAFATDPAATPTWVDISAYMLNGWVSRRGRNAESDRMQTGTASVALNNSSRIFDPTYASGTYYGNLKRMRRMDLTATWDGVSYAVWTMYVERWPQSYHGPNLSTVAIPLIDGFAVLAGARLNATYSAELSHVRIGNVLDDVYWGSGQAWVLDDPTYGLLDTTTILGPVGDRSVGVGVSTIAGATVSDTDALSHLLTVADAEYGVLFVGKDGGLNFNGRHSATQYSSPVAVFGDAEGEIPYYAIEIDDDSPIYNDVRMTREGGAEQTATDSTSIANYYLRTLQQTSIPVSTDAEMADRAAYLLARYKQPSTRIRSMVLRPQRDPSTMWPVVLSLEIGDRVTVKRRPQGVGDAISQESVVEGISHRCANGLWEVEMWLSPADTNKYMVLDDAVLAVLDSTALAY